MADPSSRWASAGCVCAAAGTELLFVRAEGPVSVFDLGVAGVLAGVLVLTRWPLAPALVYGAGLLIPAMWSRGTGIIVWLLLAVALVLLTRRRAITPRSTIAALAVAVGMVWLVVGVGQGQPPPLRDVLAPIAALVAGGILGPWVVALVPLVLVPTTTEAWSSQPPPETPQPDILYVTVDTLRFDAAQGMSSLRVGTLREGQSVAPWTLPSLATLQTGVLPGVHRAVRVPGGYSAAVGPTLAERLAAAGWDTAATLESPFTRAELGLQRGFARVRADGVRPWVLPRLPSSDRPHPTAGLLFAANGGADQRASDLVDFVSGRRDRPLFVWAHLLDAHLPYRHALELDAPILTRLWLTTAHRLSIGPRPSADTLAVLRTAYLHEVHRIDRAVLRMRAAMPDAIFVLTSDHGEELGEHGGFEHGHTFYQELLAVPIYSEGVSFPPGDPVSVADIVPGLLQAVGLGPAPVPAAAQSMNLLYGELSDRAVRVGGRKLIATGGRILSFDLEQDPGEQSPGTDTALVPELPGVPDGAEPAPLDAGANEALRALGYVE